MEVIEKATGKGITRIETTDLDVMEEVRVVFRISALALTCSLEQYRALANEESYEVAGSRSCTLLYNRCSFGGRSKILTANIFCVRVGVTYHPR
jgi:hypothetical protein